MNGTSSRAMIVDDDETFGPAAAAPAWTIEGHKILLAGGEDHAAVNRTETSLDVNRKTNINIDVSNINH